MSGISSYIDAIKLINSHKQTPDDEDARFELRCAACGYDAAVRIAPEACPCAEAPCATTGRHD